MKPIFYILAIITFSSQLILVAPAFSLDIRDRNEYLFDTRGDDGDICLNRLSLHKKIDKHDIEMSVFGEAQWSLEIDEWEKLLLGMEAGKYLWQYLYIGQSIQIISGELLDYMTFDTDSTSIDITTKIALHLPLFSKNFSFYIAEEYSLNLEEGRNEYCETISEIIYSPKELYSIGIGWRHTDRVHTLDTDYVSLSFTVDF